MEPRRLTGRSDAMHQLCALRIVSTTTRPAFDILPTPEGALAGVLDHDWVGEVVIPGAIHAHGAWVAVQPDQGRDLAGVEQVVKVDPGHGRIVALTFSNAPVTLPYSNKRPRRSVNCPGPGHDPQEVMT